MHRTLVVTILLILVAVLLYPWLKPAPNRPVPVASASDYQFANHLKLVSVPATGHRKRIFQDPVERIVFRLTWAGPEQVHFTQRHLPADAETLARRIGEQLEVVAASSPLAARQLVETLGILARPSSEAQLMRLANAPPDYLQVAAIQALTYMPESPSLDFLLAELSAIENESIARAANQAVLQRDYRFADEQRRMESVARMLAASEGSAAAQIIEECFRRNLVAVRDAVAAHLNSQSLLARQLAIKALLKFGDERGSRAAREELGSADSGRVSKSLNLYRDAGVDPGYEMVCDLARHPDPEVRLALASVLKPSTGPADRDRDSKIKLLQFLGQDASAQIRRQAIHSLHLHGDSTLLWPLRDQLRRGHGDALKEGVTFLCETLRDPESASLLRERLTNGGDAQDEATLLFGLRYVGEERDASFFIQRILAAGTPEDRLAGRVTWLSDFASQYLQTLGELIIRPLFGAFEKARTDRARLLIIDALRGVGGALQTEQKHTVLAWIADTRRSEIVRIAAADSLPFFDDTRLAKRVQEMSQSLGDRSIALRLQQIFLNYF